ncbi:50S ribosomal protein L1 [Buchnera aphidicola (Pterocallis alni)]|uniref:50S ribosomal protein L1 n=1 Tax=Buchnera aphidicola TaxID=9 RepID=UPI003464A902
MPKISKKIKQIKKEINLHKEYTINSALNLLKKFQSTKFTESVDVSIHLGINPKKTDQNIRGSTILPNGTGKKIKIAVFTQGENIKIAKKYGAEIAGGAEIIHYFKNKKKIFDIIISSPDTMHIVSKLGPILGPKGLMPNPKTGTITSNIKEAVKNAKKGQITYKNDKNGILNTAIGKINFTNQQLKENIIQLLIELKKLKPSTSKGIFIKKLILSTTMGCGIIIKINSIYET